MVEWLGKVNKVILFRNTDLLLREECKNVYSRAVTKKKSSKRRLEGSRQVQAFIERD